MADRLLISAPEALTVMLSTTGIYLSFVALLRVVGQRLVSGLGAFDLAAAMAMGALVGRVILGHTPVLAAGVVGLVTLAALQTLVGRFRDTPLGSRLITPAPVLLMADGELLRTTCAAPASSRPRSTASCAATGSAATRRSRPWCSSRPAR